MSKPAYSQMTATPVNQVMPAGTSSRPHPAQQPDLQQNHAVHPASLRSYSLGFGLSLLLTIEAYFLVVSHSFSSALIVNTVLGLAIIQLLVQLFFFLHLDRIKRSAWNIVAFSFMSLVVSIVVFGSLWIMHNLNYHMHPVQTDQYIQHQEGITH